MMYLDCVRNQTTAILSPPEDSVVCYLDHDFFTPQPQPYPIMCGAPGALYMSPKQAGRMHRSLSMNNSDFTVSYNIAMPQYVKEDHPIGIPLTITEDETWDFAIKMYQDIVVEKGSKLTISCEVKMPIQGKIIVEQGGKLVIDGGTITSAHDSLWKGIEVWGNADSSQYCITEPCPQGKLEIINGGTIENAEIAVSLWKPFDYSTTGGIVQAEDAIFRNNTKAVDAYYYSNYNPYNPGNERDNLSWFTNCIFEINDDYQGTADFSKHVYLTYVKGIDFKGCDFSVSENISGVVQYCHAISSFNAGFIVDARCANNTAPCNELDSCTFHGFYRAITSVSDGNTNYTFSIKRSRFEDNIAGVYTVNVDNAAILFNQFSIAPNTSEDKNGCIGASGVGIYMEHATGFAIEENTFGKIDNAPPGNNYIGVRINQTESSDEIYKNSFESLSYGNFSEGQNWKDGDRFKGLAYYCNENTENYADFFVCDESPSGIQSKQGNTAYSAGNTFSSSADWHIYNGGDHLVAYYYCNSCPGETPVNYNNEVVIIGQDTANPCPSHYGDEDEERQVTLTSDERLATEEDYYDNYTKYNNVESLYNNLKDGGSTQAELQTVENAQPDDMWEVRSQLLGDSPHLSMEVLKTTADKTEVFSDQAIFDIMAANPDELKKEELIKYLEEKEEPLPDYMINILEEVAEGTSYKTVLQRKMARYNRGKTRAAHDIIRSILSKDELDVQDLRNWLDNLGGLAADRQIISTYVRKGDFANAFTLAEMLPELYEMEGDALEEHGYYMDMLNLYQALEQQGRNTFQLNEQEKQQVEYIASASEGIAGSQAQNILNAVYGEHFYDCPNTQGEEGYKQSRIKPDDLNKLSGISLEVHPNPAKKWAAFDYTLPGEENQGVITITNARGNTVEKLPVQGKQGQKLWDTRTVEPGVYFYTLRAGGNTQSGKIVIAK